MPNSRRNEPLFLVSVDKLPTCSCALEISASFLAVPVRCVPGPREDACGREALGTRMVRSHPRPQAQARAALTVALGQAVDLRRNSDAEAWSHSICIPVAFLPKNMATAMKAYYKKQYILHLQKQIILKLS